MSQFEHIQQKGFDKGDHYFDGDLCYPIEVTLTISQNQIEQMHALLFEMAEKYNGIFSDQYFVNKETKEILLFESDLSKEDAEEMKEEGRRMEEIEGSKIIHVYYAGGPNFPSYEELVK